jgi:16S rRNA (guanine966-N2)-methyltransferase
VREALFSSLHARLGSLAELRVLDAFAGSGALGLEALSRGAALVVACEVNREALSTIQANAEALDAGLARFQVAAADVFSLPARLATLDPFDLVLLDPPYDTDPARINAWLSECVHAGVLAAGAVIVWEQAARGAAEYDAPITTLDEKRYGTTVLTFGQLRGGVT